MSGKRRSRNLAAVIILLIVLLGAVAGLYYFGMRHFSTHFFPGTVINGLDAGDKTVDELKYAIQDKIREYTLTVHERNGQIETITGEQLYMQYADDGALEKLMEEQDEKSWIFQLNGSHTLGVSTGFTYDEEQVDKILDGMKAFEASNVFAPTDAKIEDNGTSFEIIPGTEGNLLKRDAAKQAVMAAVQNGDADVDFEALNLYEHSSVNEDDKALQEEVAHLNQMLSARITYDFVDRQMTVDGTTIHGWIVQDENGMYSLDESKASDWVVQMARETDTFGLSHEFKTSSGNTIELEGGGDYGWLIGRESTTEQLLSAIYAGEQTTIEPIYRYKGTDRSMNDIGETYIEICIEDQTMWCYKDGLCVVETEITSGNEGSGFATPSGSVWAVDGKKKDAQFKLFPVTVEFWLPFNGDCGVHDASWRENYGGDVYKYDGSHGCINTPRDAAEKVFNAIEIGDPVVVYYSEQQVKGPEPTQEVTMG
ncbi:MAG: L,D-transpeptidase/peptidoglycan binding protein [Eubacterium sp.]|nr:L,D-transpeptidase/peptidoglycan binding protein [Eubacterium sp.]